MGGQGAPCRFARAAYLSAIPCSQKTTAEGVGERMKLTAEVLCDMSSARFPVLHASPGIQKMYGGQGTGDFFDAWHVDDCAIHEGTGSRGVTRAVRARPSAGKIETTDCGHASSTLMRATVKVSFFSWLF